MILTCYTRPSNPLLCVNRPDRFVYCRVVSGEVLAETEIPGGWGSRAGGGEGEWGWGGGVGERWWGEELDYT